MGKEDKGKGEKKMMNSISYLEGAIYKTRCGFARESAFINKIKKDFVGIDPSKKAILEKINELIKRFEKIDGNIGQTEALNLLIANDLKNIKKTIENSEIIDPEREIKENYHTLLKLMREEGIEIEAVKIFVVDKFPKPFDNMPWSVFYADKADEKEYGIPFGLYFRRGDLVPYYSSYLLACMLTHVAIGTKNPYLLGRGLEDGICDLFGSIYLGSKILGNDLIKNLVVYTRLGHGINQFWESNLDYFRQATYIYNRFGLEGIVELIKEGRMKIKEVEKYCLSGRFDKIELSSGQWVDELTEIVNYASLAYGRNLVVSPLAKYIANKLKVGDNIEKVIKDLDIKKEGGESAIKELQDRIFLILVNNQKVDYSDLNIVKDNLRYEIT